MKQFKGYEENRAKYSKEELTERLLLAGFLISDVLMEEGTPEEDLLTVAHEDSLFTPDDLIAVFEEGNSGNDWELVCYDRKSWKRFNGLEIPDLVVWAWYDETGIWAQKIVAALN